MPSWPVLRVAVAGDSMAPALVDGEWWVARRTTSCRPGDIIVFDHPVQSGLVAVKRAVRSTPDGWWVEGDNPGRSTDSRSFGAVPSDHVLGVLWIRYRPAPWRRGGPGDSRD